MPDTSQQLEYGLIAEEVADVFPELVAYGADGRPETVRYHILPALLLNEIQRQERELVAYRSELADLRQILARQTAVLEQLRATVRPRTTTEARAWR